MHVQQGAVQPFDKAVIWRSADTGCAMLDAFQLQEQFERMLSGPAAIFPAIVREQGFDAQALLLEARGPPSEAAHGYTTGQRQIGYSSPGRFADTLSTPLWVSAKKVSISSGSPVGCMY